MANLIILRKKCYLKVDMVSFLLVYSSVQSVYKLVVQFFTQW